MQLDTFGRLLDSEDDVLPGYTVDYIEIEDPRSSTSPARPCTRSSARPATRCDKVTGKVLAVTEDELEAADEYEVALYRRAPVTLASGRTAWVYLSA